MSNFTPAEIAQLTKVLAQDAHAREYRKAYNKRPYVKAKQEEYRQSEQFKEAQHKRNSEKWALIKLARAAQKEGLI